MKQLNRWGIYIVGMLVLALGLFLNARSGLGVSPLLTVAFVWAQAGGLEFGDATFLIYCVYVSGQFLVRGKGRQWRDLLQLPVGLVFSRVLNLLAVCFPYDASQHSLSANLAVLGCAIVLSGIGVSMSVNMRLVPTPGDGIVQAIADVTGREQGVVKNLFDCSCVALAALLGLVLCGKPVGVGIGTVAAMLDIGRVVSRVNRKFRARMLAAAGLEETMLRSEKT